MQHFQPFPAAEKMLLHVSRRRPEIRASLTTAAFCSGVSVAKNSRTSASAGFAARTFSSRAALTAVVEKSDEPPIIPAAPPATTRMKLRLPRSLIGTTRSKHSGQDCGSSWEVMGTCVPDAALFMGNWFCLGFVEGDSMPPWPGVSFAFPGFRPQPRLHDAWARNRSGTNELHAAVIF